MQDKYLFSHLHASYCHKCSFTIFRALREENPSNLATLCYKAVEKLVQAAETGCRTHREQQTGGIIKTQITTKYTQSLYLHMHYLKYTNCLLPVLNCVRLLTRILPYIFEDPDWRGFFWSTLPGQAAEDASQVFTIYNSVCSLSLGVLPSSTNLCTKVLCFANSPDRFACKSHSRGLTLNIFIRSLPVFVCLI